MQALVILLAVLMSVTPIASRSFSNIRCQRQLPPKHRVADRMIPYIGGSKVCDGAPKGYADLFALWVEEKSPSGYVGSYRKFLIPEKNGVIPVSGRLVFKDSSSAKYLTYEFDRAALVDKENQPIKLNFKTKAAEGVSYVFEGDYVENPEEFETGGKIYLKGVITKLKNSQEINRTTLNFTPFIIKE